MSTVVESRRVAAPRPRPLRLRIHSAMRWLHVYISMLSLLVVLFFALTGITLNHPDWVFGNAESSAEVSGQLPQGWRAGNGVDWLTVVEYLRREHGVRGSVAEHRADDTEGSVTFKAPGYSADCFFQLSSGSYRMTIASQGAVAVLNDFHRGRDAGSAWAWLIDLSGVFLTLLALTGIALLLYLKKFRVSALATMLAGAALMVVLMKLAT